MMKTKGYNHQEQRYSIRKYSIGAASVLIGCVMFANSPLVSADEVTTNTVSTWVPGLVDSNQAQADTNNIIVSTKEKTPAEVTSTSSAAVVTDNTTESTTTETKSAPAKEDVPTETVTSEPVEAKTPATEVTTTTAKSSELPEVSADTTVESTATETVDPKTISSTSADTLATSKVVTSTLSAQGTYVFTKRTEVKNAANMSQPTVFYFNEGDSVNYDKVVNEDNHTWVSYRSYSGTRRYAPIAELKTAIQESPTITDKTTKDSNLPDKGKYIFVEKAAIKNEPKTSSPTIYYYDKGESVNYDKVLTADSHQWISYVSYNGTRRYISVGEAKAQVSSDAKAPAITTTDKKEETLPSSGSYVTTDRTAVRNDAKMDSPVAFYLNKGDKINYDKVLTTNNHSWISYVSYSGTRRYIALEKATVAKDTTKDVVSTPVKQATTGTITIQNQSDKGFDVRVTDVYNKDGISEVKVPVWSEVGGQDDLIWYTASKQADGSYQTSVKVSDHKGDLGVYNVHLYYAQPNGQLKGVTGRQVTLETKAETKPITETPLPASGTYTFTERTSIKAEAKVTSPELAYYDKGDKVNYDKVVKADGYQWISYISYSGARRYLPVVKLATESAKTSDTTTKTATEATAQAVTSNLPASGTYTFTKTVDVKSEAKMASATEFNFQKGETINYDQVLVADNHEWISYKSYSGTRRYIPVATVSASQASARPAETAKASLPASGSYTMIKRSAIVNNPSKSADVVAYYNAGDKVNYDKVISRDGAQWISYISNSGVRRYINVA